MTHPAYEQPKVEAVMLELAAEHHPSHFSDDELLARVVTRPEDEREVHVARQAVSKLREFGVLSSREDGIVELTQPALHATALLTEVGALS